MRIIQSYDRFVENLHPNEEVSSILDSHLKDDQPRKTFVLTYLNKLVNNFNRKYDTQYAIDNIDNIADVCRYALEINDSYVSTDEEAKANAEECFMNMEEVTSFKEDDMMNLKNFIVSGCTLIRTDKLHWEPFLEPRTFYSKFYCTPSSPRQ